MRLQLKPPAPKLAIRVIKSNPSRRYCTKRRTVLYVAAFCQLNNLKG